MEPWNAGTGGNIMEAKKTSVNISAENYEKMKKVLESEGLTQSEFINKAIAEVPIVILGNRKLIAESFFDIRNALSEKDDRELKREVEEVCQLLNILIEKIGENKTSNV